MVLAYLRGLLKPDYPMGIRSHLREEIMIESVAREMHSLNLDKIAGYMAALAPPSVPEKTLKRMQELVRKSEQLSGLKSLTKRKHRNIDGLAAIYKALLKSDLVKKIKSERPIQPE